MQTFLPDKSYAVSASMLDSKRLNNQRNESKVILQALRKIRLGEPGGWQRHPAVLMWVGHELSLVNYTYQINRECTARGIKMPILSILGQEEILTFLDWLEAWGLLLEHETPNNKTPPGWLGHPPFHSSHRARLLEKDPEWYGQFGWTETPGGPEVYFWPTKEIWP